MTGRILLASRLTSVGVAVDGACSAVAPNLSLAWMSVPPAING
jgi:hypothetical protein